jgi:hypothetical protein
MPARHSRRLRAQGLSGSACPCRHLLLANSRETTRPRSPQHLVLLRAQFGVVRGRGVRGMCWVVGAGGIRVNRRVVWAGGAGVDLGIVRARRLGRRRVVVRAREVRAGRGTVTATAVVGRLQRRSHHRIRCHRAASASPPRGGNCDQRDQEQREQQKRKGGLLETTLHILQNAVGEVVRRTPRGHLGPGGLVRGFHGYPTSRILAIESKIPRRERERNRQRGCMTRLSEGRNPRGNCACRVYGRLYSRSLLSEESAPSVVNPVSGAEATRGNPPRMTRRARMTPVAMISAFLCTLTSLRTGHLSP